MRYTLIGLWLAVAMTAGAQTDESTPADPETPAVVSEEEAEVEIREIEKGVSGAGDVEEFVPKKPLSADKAIALPSDI